MTVTVYSKPACGQCIATERALKTNGIEFTKVDMSKDESALEMVKGLGYQQAPVVIIGDAQDHWSGFRIDKIKALAA